MSTFIRICRDVFATGYVQSRAAWEECIREHRKQCTWNAAYKHWQ